MTSIYGNFAAGGDYSNLAARQTKAPDGLSAAKETSGSASIGDLVNVGQQITAHTQDASHQLGLHQRIAFSMNSFPLQSNDGKIFSANKTASKKILDATGNSNLSEHPTLVALVASDDLLGDKSLFA
jgi:hypothetical protein